MVMKNCCICGNEVAPESDGILINGRMAPICAECGQLLDILDECEKTDPRRQETYAVLQEKMKNNGANFAVIETVAEIYAGEECEPEEQDGAYEAEVEEEEDLQDLSSRIMMTTASSLEGYHVTKQLGVVFGETVFKPSAGQSFASGVGDLFRAFSLSEKEMSGQVRLIESARNFAYRKMMKAALDRGANAIVAIDSDNTISDFVFYISLYGTAVYVEKD